MQKVPRPGTYQGIRPIKNENEKLIIGKENQFTCIAYKCVNRDRIAKCILRFEDRFMKKLTDITGMDPNMQYIEFYTSCEDDGMVFEE